MREIRLAVRRKTHAATTFGVGPRYLHSTGQYHKGGPNTALVFLITSDDETETEIPEAGYSFAVLKRAQALGDYETLEAHGRRVVRLHIKRGDAAKCWSAVRGGDLSVDHTERFKPAKSISEDCRTGGHDPDSTRLDPSEIKGFLLVLLALLLRS